MPPAPTPKHPFEFAISAHYFRAVCKDCAYDALVIYQGKDDGGYPGIRIACVKCKATVDLLLWQGRDFPDNAVKTPHLAATQS